MTLDQFLTKRRLSDAAFGAQCKPKLHRTEVYQIKKRNRSPGAVKVAAITEATGGLVTAKDLVKRRA